METNQPIKEEWKKRYDEMTKHWYSHSLEGIDLTQKEQDIVNYRNKNNKTLEETGREFGVTRERIRQIEAKAQEKIRRKTDLKEFIRECVSQAKSDGVREGREEIKKWIENKPWCKKWELAEFTGNGLFLDVDVHELIDFLNSNKQEDLSTNLNKEI